MAGHSVENEPRTAARRIALFILEELSEVYA